MSKNNGGTLTRNGNGNGRDERSDVWVRTPYWDKSVDEAFEKWLSTGTVPPPWEVLSDLLARGYKVSIKPYNGAYTCILTDIARETQGKPCLLSGWASNPDEAFLAAVFKHTQLLDCDWDSYDKETSWEPKRR